MTKEAKQAKEVERDYWYESIYVIDWDDLVSDYRRLGPWKI